MPTSSLPSTQHQDSQTCPFCRSEIKGREAVSIYWLSGETAEGGAAAVDTEDSGDQEGVEQEQVAPYAPPLPPRLDLPPRRPRSECPLEVAPLALPRLRPPFPLPRVRTVASAVWNATPRAQATEGATENS